MTTCAAHVATEKKRPTFRLNGCLTLRVGHVWRDKWTALNGPLSRESAVLSDPDTSKLQFLEAN